MLISVGQYYRSEGPGPDPVPFSPADLFAQGQQGVWYEPKPQYLFQDAEGTIPVTADGDPVGLMLDLSGNGDHAICPTSSARPTYRHVDGNHFLAFDGVDDYMRTQQQYGVHRDNPFIFGMSNMLTQVNRGYAVASAVSANVNNQNFSALRSTTDSNYFSLSGSGSDSAQQNSLNNFFSLGNNQFTLNSRAPSDRMFSENAGSARNANDGSFVGQNLPLWIGARGASSSNYDSTSFHLNFGFAGMIVALGDYSEPERQRVASWLHGGD